MSDLPTPPMFFWHPKSGSFDLINEVETVGRSNVLGAQDAPETVVYDSVGVMWRHEYEGTKKLGLLGRIGAEFFNPSRTSAILWSRVRDYDLSELRQSFKSAVEQDDDILKQFVEEEELIARIERCQTFRDMVETMEWAGTEQE